MLPGVYWDSKIVHFTLAFNQKRKSEKKSETLYHAKQEFVFNSSLAWHGMTLGRASRPHFGSFPWWVAFMGLGR